MRGQRPHRTRRLRAASLLTCGRLGVGCKTGWQLDPRLSRHRLHVLPVRGRFPSQAVQPRPMLPQHVARLVGAHTVHGCKGVAALERGEQAVQHGCLSVSG